MKIKFNSATPYEREWWWSPVPYLAWANKIVLEQAYERWRAGTGGKWQTVHFTQVGKGTGMSLDSGTVTTHRRITYEQVQQLPKKFFAQSAGRVTRVAGHLYAACYIGR